MKNVMATYGDGALMRAGSVKMMASIVQHGITPRAGVSKVWMADFARAWKAEAKTMGVRDPGHFDIDATQATKKASAKKTAARRVR